MRVLLSFKSWFFIMNYGFYKVINVEFNRIAFMTKNLSEFHAIITITITFLDSF
jgi:iron only hydrogenase large subunit-like protein